MRLVALTVAMLALGIAAAPTASACCVPPPTSGNYTGHLNDWPHANKRITFTLNFHRKEVTNFKVGDHQLFALAAIQKSATSNEWYFSITTQGSPVHYKV